MGREKRGLGLDSIGSTEGPPGAQTRVPPARTDTSKQPATCRGRQEIQLLTQVLCHQFLDQSLVQRLGRQPLRCQPSSPRRLAAFGLR